MEEYKKVYAFLPYFEKLAEAREHPENEVEIFVKTSDVMYPEYAEEMNDFHQCIYEVKYTDTNYVSTLKEYNVLADDDLMKRILTADGRLLIAIMTRMIREERFAEGAWISYEKGGLFYEALSRMGEIYGYSL